MKVYKYIRQLIHLNGTFFFFLLDLFWWIPNSYSISWVRIATSDLPEAGVWSTWIFWNILNTIIIICLLHAVKSMFQTTSAPHQEQKEQALTTAWPLSQTNLWLEMGPPLSHFSVDGYQMSFLFVLRSFCDVHAHLETKAKFIILPSSHRKISSCMPPSKQF